MIAAGIVGGMAWAAIPAFLRTRYRVSEVLSTLMLVYVALQVLNYLVSGPWKDPNGHNFPQTPPFTPAQLLPARHCREPTFRRASSSRFVLTLVFWLLTTRSVYGFSVRTVGAAPSAARYGGFDASRTVWSTLMISGGMAGLAGILEASSQLGQINLGFPSGYGFTAIIVSFLGRLHPVGVFLAGLILAVTYVGGQVAQTVVHVPERDRRHLPGDDAVLHSRERHPGAIPPADHSRRPARRARGGCRMNVGFLHRRAHHRGRRDDADPARRDGRTRGREERRAQSSARGHDADRRGDRLRRHARHSAPISAIWRRGSACWPRRSRARPPPCCSPSWC